MSITTLYLTGFEHGLMNVNGAGLFSSVQGSPAISSAAPRNGTYHARLAASANAALNARFLLASANAKIVSRIAIKVSSLPSSGVAGIYFHETTAGSFIYINIDSNGQLSISNAAGTATVTGPTIDTTNFHLIEIQSDVSANPWVVDWKVDGVAQTRHSPAVAATTVNRLGIGTNATTLPAFTADYDDWIFGIFTTGTDWYGDGKVLGQVAASDGTHSGVGNFSPGDAGTAYSGTVTTAYQMVDDPPPWAQARSSTDNIAMRTVNTNSYMEIAPATTSETGQANAVRALLAYSASGTQANAAGCDVRNSAGTVSELWGLTGGVLKDYSESLNQFKGAIVTVPGAGWTASEVNAVRFRFGGGTSSDISPIPTAQMMMLEVDWPVAGATEISGSDSGTGTDSTSALDVAVSASDSATGTETSVIDISSSDSGTGSETSNVSTLETISASDSGTGTDASVSIEIPTSDSGSGTDATSVLSVTTSASDSGTGTETSSIGISGSDSGSGSDATQTLSAATSASESGTGTDSSTSIGTSTSDSGTGTDASSINAAVTATNDSGSGTDSSVSIEIPTSESGSGTDATSTLAVASTTSDSGSGTDASTSIGISTSESGSGSDATSTLAAAVSSAGESGSGTDTGGTINTSSGGDSGAATDATSSADATLSATDSGSGSDSSSVDTGGGGPTTVSGSDSGTATDQTSSLAVTLSASESGTADDQSSIVVNISASDSGTASDQTNTLAVAVTTSENGTGNDQSVSVDYLITSSDSGSASDIASITALLFGNDTATASESSNIDGNAVLTIGTTFQKRGTTTAIDQNELVGGSSQTRNRSTTSQKLGTTTKVTQRK